MRVKLVLSQVGLCGLWIENYEQSNLIKIGYITITCGLTPSLHTLGMRAETSIIDHHDHGQTWKVIEECFWVGQIYCVLGCWNVFLNCVLIIFAAIHILLCQAQGNGLEWEYIKIQTHFQELTYKFSRAGRGVIKFIVISVHNMVSK